MSKAQPPRNVAAFFALVGPRNKTLICAVFETDTGSELRLSYSDGHVMDSASFPAGLDIATRMAAKADEWKRAWIEKGFREVVA
jgi:hypothetical protein